MKSWKWLSTAAFTFVFVTCVSFFLNRSGFNFEGVFGHLKGIDSETVILLFFLACLQVTLQSTRLHVLLKSVLEVRILVTLRLHAVGQLLNAFLPARAGDVYKVSSITKLRSKENSVEVGEVIGVVFAGDKIADLVATISMALVFAPFAFDGLSESERFTTISRLYGPWVLTLGIAVALATGYSGKFQRLFRVVRQIFETVFVKISIHRYLIAYTLAVLSFSVECGALVILVREMAKVDIGFYTALWVLIVVNLGVAVPITMANLGAFEAAMTFGLNQFGVQGEVALAIALVHHSIQIASTIGMSLLSTAINISWKGVGRHHLPE